MLFTHLTQVRLPTPEYSVEPPSPMGDAALNPFADQGEGGHVPPEEIWEDHPHQPLIDPHSHREDGVSTEDP